MLAPIELAHIHDQKLQHVLFRRCSSVYHAIQYKLHSLHPPHLASINLSKICLTITFLSWRVRCLFSFKLIYTGYFGSYKVIAVAWLYCPSTCGGVPPPLPMPLTNYLC